MIKTFATSEKISDFLEIPFFRGLPDSLLQSIKNAVVFRSYIPGKLITTKGTPNQSPYMILKGNANVFCTSSQGKDFVITKLGPGDWFNTMTCLHRAEYDPASVEAITPVKCLILSCPRFHKLYEEEPQFAIRVLENIASRLPKITNKLERLALLSVSGRVANFLLEHADNDGVIYWRCTQNDIANRIGTVAEVVGRNFRQFADESLILMPSKNCIIIKNREGLLKKAQY
jgi:CRP/FNR family transcriptional regulator